MHKDRADRVIAIASRRSPQKRSRILPNRAEPRSKLLQMLHSSNSRIGEEEDEEEGEEERIAIEEQKEEWPNEEEGAGIEEDRVSPNPSSLNNSSISNL